MGKAEEAESQREVAVAALNLAVSAEQLSIALRDGAYDKIVTDRRAKLNVDLEVLKNALAAAGLVQADQLLNDR